MTPLLCALTEREEAVIVLFAEGHGRREIARRLACSPWTVKHHADSARDKLGATTIAHAVALLIRARLEAGV